MKGTMKAAMRILKLATEVSIGFAPETRRGVTRKCDGRRDRREHREVRRRRIVP